MLKKFDIDPAPSETLFKKKFSPIFYFDVLGF